MKECGYSDYFSKLNQKDNDLKMTFDPTSVEVTCVTLPKDHFIQVPWKYVKVCGYSDPLKKKNLNQRSLTPRWPLTPSLLRSHVWLYPRFIVSRSHGNTSMYVDTVINFAKYHIHTTYTRDIYKRTYYVQNEWSHSLFLNQVLARQKGKKHLCIKQAWEYIFSKAWKWFKKLEKQINCLKNLKMGWNKWKLCKFLHKKRQVPSFQLEIIMPEYRYVINM